MPHKNITLHKVFMAESAIQKTLSSGFIGQGPEVAAFEQELAAYLQTNHVLCVNSCTSGLQLVLSSLDGEGDILSSPLTCLATNMAILNSGHRIRWVDIDPTTCCMDMSLAAKETAKAAVVVHWGGTPVSADLSIPVISDCAHAFGSSVCGRMVGSYADSPKQDASVFSFGAIKTLTCGDGGLVTVSSGEFLEKLRLRSWYGLSRADRNVMAAMTGWKYHMNDIAACLGRANLPHVNLNVMIQRKNAADYQARLAGTAGIQLLRPSSDSSHWLYTILVERREDFIRKLKEYGIESSPVHVRNDLHPVMAPFAATLPQMDYVHSRMTCLPCGWWVTPYDIDYIIEIIRGGW